MRATELIQIPLPPILHYSNTPIPRAPSSLCLRVSAPSAMISLISNLRHRSSTRLHDLRLGFPTGVADLLHDLPRFRSPPKNPILVLQSFFPSLQVKTLARGASLPEEEEVVKDKLIGARKMVLVSWSKYQ